MTTAKHIAAALGFAVMLTSNVLLAQNIGVTRTVVTKADVSIPSREAILVKVDVAPNGSIDWHVHPGDEVSYVQEGEIELLTVGLPPRVIKAGEGFVIPAGTVHSAKNHGSATLKLVGVFVVEKGKAFATPAAAPEK